MNILWQNGGFRKIPTYTSKGQPIAWVMDEKKNWEEAVWPPLTLEKLFENLAHSLSKLILDKDSEILQTPNTVLIHQLLIHYLSICFTYFIEGVSMAQLHQRLGRDNNGC